MTYLRYKGLNTAQQTQALKEIIRNDEIIWRALQLARSLDLPDWWIVSGAIYNSVWNNLTGKPSGYGIKDIDLFYFNGSDISFEGEDAIIKRGDALFDKLPIPVEIRNQARVHLWYEKRFGSPCPRYQSASHSLQYFAAQTHAVGVSIGHDDTVKIIAPFGLEAIFSLQMVPNYNLENRETYEKKANRAKTLWQEIKIVEWCAPLD